MGTIEQPASKSSWDSLDFGDISMVLKMAHFRKSTGPRWVKGSLIWYRWSISQVNLIILLAHFNNVIFIFTRRKPTDM